MKKIPMTIAGFARLEEELRHLKTVERPKIIEAIGDARALGDLSENAEYHSAKERQGYIEAKIKDLESKISFAEVIDPKTVSGDTVRFSALVTVVDEETDKESQYQIVGDDEADIQKGKIAFTAPLARSLIGKRIGDSIEVRTPGGAKFYEILKIEFK